MMQQRVVRSEGFTLIELMITMLISGFIISAIYGAYMTQNRVYIAQEEVVEMQQNIRATLVALTRDIQMAGYDLTGTASTGFINGDTFSDGTTNVAVLSDNDEIAFTVDLDGDGVIDQIAEDTNGDGNVDITEMEQIAYRLNGTDLERYSTLSGTGTWVTVAEQIERIEFQYLDGDENVTADMDEVKLVKISLLARVGRPDLKFLNSRTYTSSGGIAWAVNDNYRRRYLITSILCRNMGG